MIHNEKNNQSVETDTEITEVTKLADRDVKTTVINTFQKLKMPEENMNMMRRQTEDV